MPSQPRQSNSEHGSGSRAPALPEDMIERAVAALKERGEYAGTYEDDVRAVLDAAGVPGLVQRLTEAEELLREARGTVKYAGNHDEAARIDAFLSVGEGRSREGAGETDE